eukprot:841559-Rhodomonas_salina.1
MALCANAFDCGGAFLYQNLEQLNASRAYAADIPLSPLGHQQAQELANFLARQVSAPPPAIFSREPPNVPVQAPNVLRGHRNSETGPQIWHADAGGTTIAVQSPRYYYYNVLRPAHDSTDVGLWYYQRVSVVISSPYLRTLQVAQKVSHATGAKIWVEPGLCEGPRHVKGTLPPLEERYRYFPEIDMSYKPATEEPDYEEEDLSVGVSRAERAHKRLDRAGVSRCAGH